MNVNNTGHETETPVMSDIEKRVEEILNDLPLTDESDMPDFGSKQGFNIALAAAIHTNYLLAHIIALLEKQK